MTEQQTEIEKQRALDRAIDYEDRLARVPQRKGSHMDERKDVKEDIEQELIDATSELVSSRARLRDICRRYAGVTIPFAKVAVTKPGEEQTRQVKGRTRGLKQSLPGKKQFYKKVKCIECGTVTGSRLLEGRSLPLNHNDPRSGQRCTGIDKPGELVPKAG